MPNRRPRLDATDLALIGALQANARVKLEELGRIVNLVPSSVHERLRRLDREGVIQSWTINVSPAAFGLEILALVGVNTSKPCSEMIDDLLRLPEIEECHSVAGELSLVLKVRVPTTSDLLAFVEGLRQVPGVVSTVTTVTLKTHFERGTRPIDPG